MCRRVILVTGAPCVGKTAVARLLASKLDALYVNLTKPKPKPKDLRLEKADGVLTLKKP